ncbi:hypothetical protein Tco_1086166 [Tanacetum coccineum]
MVEGTENVENDEVVNSVLNNQNDPNTRLDPWSYKESPEVEKTVVEQPVNVIEEEDKSVEDDYELRRRVKGKNTRFLARKKFNVLAQHLQEVMEESLPNMVDDRVKELTKTQVPLYVAEGLIMERKHNQADVAKMIADTIQQERENLRAEITLQINNAITNHIPSQVDSSVRSYMSGHILHVHPTQASQASPQEQSSTILPRDQDDPYDDAHPERENSEKSEPGPSTSGNQEQLDDFDFWTDTYATDDDKLPTEKVSQELVEEMSETVDEAKLRKHTSVIKSCQRDPKAPALSLVNQDLLYLKKGNLGSEKFVLSLHKFPEVIFLDDDIEERTSRWTKRTRKAKRRSLLKFKDCQVIKTYGELGHKQKFITKIIAIRENDSIVSIIEPDYKNLNNNDIEDMYFLCINGKVDDYVETGLLWSLSDFIRCTVIWERVHDFQLGVESYQQKVNITAPTITFPGIEKHNMYSIISEPVYGIIYKNIKKEKRVMRHQEIHKFCDATLKRVLEGLKSYNNDVKHGYVTPSLSKEDVEYLQLFKEEIEERLKHCDQMRRWEIYI